MKWFLIVLLMASFLMSEEIGRYQLSVSTAVSKKGKVYVVEAVIDTKTGKSVPAPMFSRVYKLNSVENSGSFTWHGYNVNLLRKVDDAGIYQMARDFHNSLKKGQAKAEAYSEEESNY